MQYFIPDEFKCGCGCGLGAHDMDSDLLLKLDCARAVADMPIVITSAIRCEEHNRAQGGSKTSSHLSGRAVDLVIPNNHSRFVIKEALKEVGFTRIGDCRNGRFIHVDNDPSKDQFVEWLY
jgi:zinc D-Ala-D-Ala carboxypeptidase